MSETTKVAPASDANRDFEQFVPPGTRDNYLQIVRDAAATNGSDPKAELAKLADSFRDQHKSDPTGGWDHLAAWADQADPSEGQQPDPVAVAKAKAIESARRDPGTALAGDPDVAAAAVESLAARAEDERPDSSTGVVPNPGPLVVDVPSSAERAAESTDAGAESTPLYGDGPVSSDVPTVTDGTTEVHGAPVPEGDSSPHAVVEPSSTSSS